jgi:hypothetical protein
VTGLTQEQNFLLALSRMVWTKRDAAKVSQLSFSEETITETILLDLKTLYPGNVRVVAYNKPQEAKTGADWIWSFVSADRSRSATMLVQAKRLEDAELEYPGIKRNIGNRTPSVRQIDQLLDTARILGIPAIYAFYNHVSNSSRVPQTCRSLKPTDPNQIFCFGISLAEASIVERTLPDEQFDTHCNHSIPLHCLLCNGGSPKRPLGGTPDLVASGLRRLRDLALGEQTGVSDSGVRQGLHPAVVQALAFEDREADEVESRTDREYPNIAGVVVIEDSEQ